MARIARVCALALLAACCGRAPEPVAEPDAAPEAPAPEPAPAPSPDLPPRPAPAPSPPPAPAPAPVPEPVPSPDPAAPGLGLEELGERIKQTRAIGAFTKLALKNDIDDLLEALGRFHKRGEGRIDELRNRFEALTLKLQALLEDGEPELARALAHSREEIWRMLADPLAFGSLQT